jgi:hypothetical protein
MRSNIYISYFMNFRRHENKMWKAPVKRSIGMVARLSVRLSLRISLGVKTAKRFATNIFTVQSNQKSRATQLFRKI